MYWHSDKSQYREPSPTTAELLPQLFPALRVVTISATVTPAELQVFVMLYADALAAVSTVEFRLYVPDKTMYEVYRKAIRVDEYPKRTVDDLETRCLAVYMQATRKLLGRDGKRVTWQSHDRSDEYGMCIYFDLLWEDRAAGSHPTKSEIARLAKRFEAQMSI
jgi:hypothetical protein